MHLHSLVWSALALFAVLALYRTLLGPGFITALAIALYALDDARGWFGSWIAARNAVIATAFSTFALVLYVRARQKRATGAASRQAEWLSAMVFALALLAGKARSRWAILFASRSARSCAARRSWSFARTRWCWSAGGLCIASSATEHSARGCTSIRSAIAGFLQAFAERAPILLFSQLGGTWSDAWSALFAFPTLHKVLVTTAVLVIATLGYVLWPLLRSDKLVRFGAIGALLSLLPASSAFSADRLLTWVAIGASLVLARLIATYWQAPDVLRGNPVRAFLVAPLMLWLVLDHAIGEPLFLPSRARGNLAMRNILDRAQAGVPGDASIAEKYVIYINPAAVPLAAYVPIERGAQGLPRAAFQTWLATADTELRVTRTGPSTLTVQLEAVTCSARLALALRPDEHVRARRRDRPRPSDRPGEDVTSDARTGERRSALRSRARGPDLRVAAVERHQFAPFTPPAIGKSVTFPPPTGCASRSATRFGCRSTAACRRRRIQRSELHRQLQAVGDALARSDAGAGIAEQRLTLVAPGAAGAVGLTRRARELADLEVRVRAVETVDAVDVGEARRARTAALRAAPRQWRRGQTSRRRDVGARGELGRSDLRIGTSRKTAVARLCGTAEHPHEAVA